MTPATEQLLRGSTILHISTLTSVIMLAPTVFLSALHMNRGPFPLGPRYLASYTWIGAGVRLLSLDSLSTIMRMSSEHQHQHHHQHTYIHTMQIASNMSPGPGQLVSGCWPPPCMYCTIFYNNCVSCYNTPPVCTQRERDNQRRP